LKYEPPAAVLVFLVQSMGGEAEGNMRDETGDRTANEMNLSSSLRCND
jgi:hypothetical protein